MSTKERKFLPIRGTQYVYERRSKRGRFEIFDAGTMDKGKFFADIHVHSNFEYTHADNYEKERWTQAKVSSPSVGAQPSKVTAEFAKVLLWASRKAAQLDRKHKVVPDAGL